MNTKNSYTALTIGPILKTLQSVKSTKAIWAASYMFSYLMKKIIERINNSGIELILPYSKEVEINAKPTDPLKDKTGTGLFPDILIIKGKFALQEIIDEVLKDFAVKSNIHEGYLKSYINLYHFSVSLNESENVIIKIRELLDSIELQQRVLEKPNDNSLFDFFESKRPYNFLILDEFKARPFPSTIEISTSEFEDKYKNDDRYIKAVKKLKDGDDENQIEFIKDIKAIVADGFRNYQKYIAVVQADGDNIGTFIKFLYDQPDKKELIERFSKNLLSFAIEAVELIKTYKGTPIYAGGDDLLFFAPVAHSQYNTDNKTVSIKKSILTLIKEIDDKFDTYFLNDSIFTPLINNSEAVKKFENKGEKFKKPSMSYGVSISYYKFPLNQALEEGINQLFYTAKKTKKKNAVSYTILKHSGQFFGATFHRDDPSYASFTELIKQNVTGDNFIHSIVYKLEPQKRVLQSIGEKNNPQRDTMFDNFFENNFNESIHKKPGTKELIDFLVQTKNLFKSVYEENPIKGTDEEKKEINDNNILKIYSALRYIDFIHNKEERDD